MTAIRSMPLTTVPAAQHAQPINHAGHTMECAVCGKVFCGAAIVTGPLEVDFDGSKGGMCGQWYRPRWLFCDHCEEIQFWFQMAHPNGQLLNVPYSDLSRLKDKNLIAKWLAKHPEAAGVEQA